MRRRLLCLLFLPVLWLAAGRTAWAAAPVIQSVAVHHGMDTEPKLYFDYHWGVHVTVRDEDGAPDIVSVTVTDAAGGEYTVTPASGDPWWQQLDDYRIYCDWALFDQRTELAGTYTITATDSGGHTDSLVTPVIPTASETGPQPLWPVPDSVVSETLPVFGWSTSGLPPARYFLTLGEEANLGAVWSVDLGEQSGPTISVPCGVELDRNRTYLLRLNAIWQGDLGASDPRVELWIGHRTFSRFTVYGDWGATPPALPGKLAYMQFDRQWGGPGIMQYNTDPWTRIWLTSDVAHQPDWSPDGTHLLYYQTLPSPPGLCIDALDGSPPVFIPGSSDWVDARWAPDGERIAYSSFGDIWVAYLDGTDSPYPLTPRDGYTDRFPSWSPDGLWVAYGRSPALDGSALWLVREDGTDNHPVVAAGVDGYPGYSVVAAWSGWKHGWSPDGAKLVISLCACGPDGSPMRAIGTISRDGGLVTPVFIAPPGMECCARPQDPAWSPDGTQIVFSSGHHLTPDPTWALGKLESGVELWLANADGSGEPIRLTYDYSWNGYVSWWALDTTPPVLVPPSDVTVEESDPTGTTVDLGQPTVSDLRDPNPVVTNNAPAKFPLGATTVTWTATDASGNTATAQQKVTVVPGSLANQLANLRRFIVLSVASGGIAAELESSLLAKVDAAIAALARGNPNDAKAAMGGLKALVNQVEAQTDNKIDPATAAEIIRRANQVIAALGG